MVTARIRHLANIKGDRGATGSRGLQGAPGTFAGASAESVPASEEASVQMSGGPEARYAHFKIPQGLPGLNAVPTDEAIEVLIKNRETLTHGSLTGRFPDKGASVDGMPAFDRLSFEGQIAFADPGDGIGYPCVVSNRDGWIPSGVNYYGFYSTDHAATGSPGIMMVTFDQHGDPWVNPIAILNRGSQLETPWMIKDRARGRLLMYASGSNMNEDPGEHQESNQVTVCWSTTPARFSADPTDWDYQGISHDRRTAQDVFLSQYGDSGHGGYQKPAILGGGFVSTGLTGGVGGLGFRDVYFSTEGTRFFRGYLPMKYFPDANYSLDGKGMVIDHFFEWNGQTWGAIRARYRASGTSQTTGTLLMVARMRDDLATFAGRPQTIFIPPESGNGNNGDIRGFCLVVEDSTFHLYYGSDIVSVNYARVGA